MKIGIFEFAIDRSVDPAIVAKRTEELGFCLVLGARASDHSDSDHPRPIRVRRTGLFRTSTVVFWTPLWALARASAVTSTIELGTGICLIPERNPLMLAKEVATLDKLSGGRFILGIGAGWLREETEIMGGDFDSYAGARPRTAFWP